MSETVNRNGEIFIPRVGTLKLWGFSFEKAEQLIRDQLSRAYTRFRISVMLGRLRTIRVFVVGEAARPGAYTLSALSTLTNVLFAAGGRRSREPCGASRSCGTTRWSVSWIFTTSSSGATRVRMSRAAHRGVPSS